VDHVTNSSVAAHAAASAAAGAAAAVGAAAAAGSAGAAAGAATLVRTAAPRQGGRPAAGAAVNPVDPGACCAGDACWLADVASSVVSTLPRYYAACCLVLAAMQGRVRLAVYAWPLAYYRCSTLVISFACPCIAAFPSPHPLYAPAAAAQLSTNLSALGLLSERLDVLDRYLQASGQAARTSSSSSCRSGTGGGSKGSCGGVAAAEAAC
jgi:hypothetical protein